MNRKQETMRRVEERLRQAAPPVPQDTRSVWPAVQERLQVRQRPARVRPLLWAGAGLVAASLCLATWIMHGPLVTPAPNAAPTKPIFVSVMPSAHPAKRLRRPVRVHKETVAVTRPTHPHPSHIAFKRPVETSPATQSPVPEADNTPRLRPASAVPRPASVKPID